MALSNWLTRDEWDACFVMGHKSEKESKGLGDVLRNGIGELVKAGYKFTGIEADEEGNYEKITQCCGDNAPVLGELIDGSFDVVGRAKNGVRFIKSLNLNIDLSNVEEQLKEIKKA